MAFGARTIGPYQVVRELGRGAMGVVFEARDTRLNRLVALKLILPHSVSPEILERFRREAELLGRVDHPNVVSIHEVGQAPEGHYLVTNLVEGEDLHGVVRRGVLRPTRAAEIARDLAGALAAIHAQGILHRDLKPANVILQADGSPILLDFGIARDHSAQRLTQTGMVLGTPAYMSPEQAQGEIHSLDSRADVYGLGALLFDLLLGRAPFSGQSEVNILMKVVTQDPEWPDPGVVPADLEAIVRRAMAKNPNDRHPTAEALGTALAGFLEGGPAAPAPRRRSKALPFFVSALVIAIGLGAWALVPPPDETAPESSETTSQPEPTPESETKRPKPGPKTTQPRWLSEPGASPGYAWTRFLADGHLVTLDANRTLKLLSPHEDGWRTVATLQVPILDRFWQPAVDPQRGWLAIPGISRGHYALLVYKRQGSGLVLQRNLTMQVKAPPRNQTMAMAFSPEGALALGMASGRMFFVDPASGREVRRRLLHLGRNPVMGLAFSPDGRYLVSASGAPNINLSGTGGFRARVWDLQQPDRQIPDVPIGPATCLDIAPDNQTVAVGTFWYRVYVFRIGDAQGTTLQGSHIGQHSDQVGAGILKLGNAAHNGSVRDLRFFQRKGRLMLCSVSGTVLVKGKAARTGELRVWDMTTRKETRPPLLDLTHLASVDVSPDGLTLAFGSMGAGLAWWRPAGP